MSIPEDYRTTNPFNEEAGHTAVGRFLGRITQPFIDVVDQYRYGEAMARRQERMVSFASEAIRRFPDIAQDDLQGAVEHYLDVRQITKPTTQTIMDAVDRLNEDELQNLFERHQPQIAATEPDADTDEATL